MASTFLKPTKIVDTALGLLVRELSLPQLVWRQPVGDFAGVLNDTVNVRLPAFIDARSRTLRAGTSRTQDNLFERKVDIVLDTDIYLDISITDEQLTLDIANFGQQVLNPMVAGMARKLESLLATTISGATYNNTISYTISSGDVYKDIAVKARQYLNNSYVPFDGRVLVVGSVVEAEFLKNSLFVQYQQSGETATRTDGFIGRVAGMQVYSSPAIAGNEAYAFHQTAYALSTAAPLVPAGAPFGATSTYQGIAMRVVRIFDPVTVADRLILDCWMGSTAVKDTGRYDADPSSATAPGKFIPVTDPANPVTGHTNTWLNDTARLVRGVKITAS